MAGSDHERSPFEQATKEKHRQSNEEREPGGSITVHQHGLRQHGSIFETEFSRHGRWCGPPFTCHREWSLTASCDRVSSSRLFARVSVGKVRHWPDLVLCRMNDEQTVTRTQPSMRESAPCSLYGTVDVKNKFVFGERIENPGKATSDAGAESGYCRRGTQCNSSARLPGTRFPGARRCRRIGCIQRDDLIGNFPYVRDANVAL
jgi:hypothetical protein